MAGCSKLSFVTRFQSVESTYSATKPFEFESPYHSDRKMPIQQPLSSIKSSLAPDEGKERSNKKLVSESVYGSNKSKKASVYRKGVAQEARNNGKANESKSSKYSEEVIGPLVKYLTKSNYTIVGELGEGSYAKVYKVQTAKGKFRAAKVIDLSKATDNYRVKFMPRELEVLKDVSDANIIRVYQILSVKELVIIILEYAAGGPLTALLKKGPLPEKRTKELFAKIAAGINFLHGKKIAHRDMKLENILLDAEGDPKLTDFSYSLVCKPAAGESYMSKTFCGTLPYLPPEMLNELPYDPLAADVWSLVSCLIIVLPD